MVGLWRVRAEWMAVRAVLRAWTGRMARERAAREAVRADSEGVEVVRDMVVVVGGFSPLLLVCVGSGVGFGFVMRVSIFWVLEDFAQM